MGTSAFTVTFDAVDPHRQAAFWATALNWQVEDHSTLIAGLKQAGYVGEDDVIDVDGRPSWKTAAAVRDPDDPVEEGSGMGQGGRLLFQVVPESKTAKNRVHLDVRVGAASAAKIKQLTGLGATVIGEGEQGGRTWVVLVDPEATSSAWSDPQPSIVRSSSQNSALWRPSVRSRLRSAPRNSTRRILPLMVLGSSANSIRRIRLNGASRPRQ